MKRIPGELIRELITSEEFKTTGDIMEAIKSMFADMPSEVLEAELDTTLGYGSAGQAGRRLIATFFNRLLFCHVENRLHNIFRRTLWLIPLAYIAMIFFSIMSVRVAAFRALSAQTPPFRSRGTAISRSCWCAPVCVMLQAPSGASKSI